MCHVCGVLLGGGGGRRGGSAVVVVVLAVVKGLVVVAVAVAVAVAAGVVVVLLILACLKMNRCVCFGFKITWCPVSSDIIEASVSVPSSGL